jgi:hypothetical protein
VKRRPQNGYSVAELYALAGSQPVVRPSSRASSSAIWASFSAKSKTLAFSAMRSAFDEREQ